MKKILSVAAALALVVVLSVSAFAADAVPSVTYAEDDITSKTETVEVDGEEVELVISQAELTTAEEDTLPDAVEAVVEANEVSAVEVIDVDLINPATGESVSEDYFEENKSLTVVFVRDNTTTEVVAVLYWNADTQKWDEAAFTNNSNGTISVTFEHLCTVAFVTKDIEVNPSPQPTTKPGGEDNKKSPATGYNTAIWAAAATVLILAAGYCFVSARKRVMD